MTPDIKEADLLLMVRSAFPDSDVIEADLPMYVVLGRFSRQLLRWHDDGDIETLYCALHLIERLYLHGDGYVREAAVIGILESIQNICSHDGSDAERIGRRLLPASRRSWDQLNAFWHGKHDAVGDAPHNR